MSAAKGAANIMFRHGCASDGRRTPEYTCWMDMRQRCRGPTHRNYRLYGGRGISVCERWDSFPNFLEDMGPRPSSKHSLDRIDTNGNYEPDNCRWATAEEQSNNKRNVRTLTVDGVTLSYAQWGRRIGVDKNTIADRIRRGWSANEVILPRGTRGRHAP